jgi:hypothetical protein
LAALVIGVVAVACGLNPRPEDPGRTEGDNTGGFKPPDYPTDDGKTTEGGVPAPAEGSGNYGSGDASDAGDAGGD